MDGTHLIESPLYSWNSRDGRFTVRKGLILVGLLTGFLWVTAIFSMYWMMP